MKGASDMAKQSGGNPGDEQFDPKKMQAITV